MYYGLSQATDIELRSDGVRFRVDGVEFESPMQGRHAIRNILAGLAVARVVWHRSARRRETQCVRSRQARCAGSALTRNGIDDHQRLLQLESRCRPRHAGRASGYPGTAANRRAGRDARTRTLVRAFAPGRRSLCCPVRDNCARWDTRRRPFLGGVGGNRWLVAATPRTFSTIPSRPASVCAQLRRKGMPYCSKAHAAPA